MVAVIALLLIVVMLGCRSGASVGVGAEAGS